MDSPFDTWLTKGAVIGAIVIGMFAAWHWQRAAVPDTAPAAPSAHAWDGPVGPGLASGGAGQFPALGASLPAPPEPGMEVDAAGHLVLNLALRKVMDAYLVNVQPASRRARAEELRAFLKGKLPAPAADEADRVVIQYLDYLDAEERYLARERFSAPAAAGLSERDVERLLAWHEQRAQQRQRVLGPALAQAWFEADDARCGAMLRDWQLQHLALEPGQELDQAELRERRIHGAALEERRDADAQRCAAEMSGANGAGR
ncbi:MAG: hypothetical protein JWQ01_611 [Massilia sp.]|nr:hypothetical protein [Massilia sp.]